MKIEEMALRDLPVIITGNGWNDWDENEVKRKGYVIGANAVLKEIIKAFEQGGIETMVEKINELKGGEK